MAPGVVAGGPERILLDMEKDVAAAPGSDTEMLEEQLALVVLRAKLGSTRPGSDTTETAPG
jgi:hypothetical protein